MDFAVNGAMAEIFQGPGKGCCEEQGDHGSCEALVLRNNSAMVDLNNRKEIECGIALGSDELGSGKGFSTWDTEQEYSHMVRKRRESQRTLSQLGFL